MSEVAPATPVVEFFWRPGCPFCKLLERSLRRKRIPVTKRNIWDDPAAAELVRKAARGNETVPTIHIAGTYLVNPSIRQVLDLLQSTTGPNSGR